MCQLPRSRVINGSPDVPVRGRPVNRHRRICCSSFCLFAGLYLTVVCDTVLVVGRCNGVYWGVLGYTGCTGVYWQVYWGNRWLCGQVEAITAGDFANHYHLAICQKS